MKRLLSQNEIEEEIQMFETIEQQSEVLHQQEQREAARAHSWPSFKRDAPLTDEQLTALREAAQTCGRPLTDEERSAILGLKLVRTESGIKII
jgi:hypothetical protein